MVTSIEEHAAYVVAANRLKALGLFKQQTRQVILENARAVVDALEPLAKA